MPGRYITVGLYSGVAVSTVPISVGVVLTSRFHNRHLGVP